MAITMICGNLGSAKTATMVYMGLVRYKDGINLFSNFNIYDNKYNIPISKYVNSFDILRTLKRGCLLMDEIWSLIDAREFKEKKNKTLSDILLVSRKREVDIIGTAQDFGQIDNRLRNVTSYVIYPEIYIIINNRRYILEKNVLKPVKLAPLLPFCHVRCNVCERNKISLEFTDIVQTFSYPLSIAAHCFDTNEEVSTKLEGLTEK